MTNLKKVFIRLVKGYQKFISPLFAPSCRYYPTCSNYAVQAIEMHGVLKGSFMSAARIIRCNPFVHGGVDKVPDHFTLQRNPATVNHIYLGDGMTIDPDNPAYNKKAINKILDQYESDLTVHDGSETVVEQLRMMVDLEEQSVAQLPDAYIDMNKKILLKEGYFKTKAELENNLSLHFFKVIENKKSQSYFHHVHPSPIAKEFESGESVYCFVDDEIGVLDSNSPELQEAFTLLRGITLNDIETRNAQLTNYLLALKGEREHDNHVH